MSTFQSYFKEWVDYWEVPSERPRATVSAPREDADHNDKEDEIPKQ